MNTRSITVRLVTLYGIAVAVAGLSFAFYTYYGFGHYVDSVLQNTLRSRAEDVAYLALPVLGQHEELAAQIEKRFMPEAHGRYIRVIIDGRPIYSSGRSSDGGDASENVPTDLAPGLTVVGDLYVYVLKRDASDGRPMIIQSGQSARIVRTARSGLVYTLLWALPLLLVVAAVGAWALVRRALTPVTAMTSAVQQISAGELHRRLDVPPTGDVIEELGRTLNAMLANLEGAYLHASRFSADAAHEMRAPLAVIRGELESVLLKMDLEPEVATAIETAADENDRLRSILDNLLQLEVLEYGEDKTATRVDLRELCSETVEQLQVLAKDRGMSLVMEPSGEAHALGDRQRLKQVVVNLVDNAIKYSRVGGAITVTCWTADGDSKIRVADEGVGISMADQKRVFDRFYRVDAESGLGGAGLGLSIVAAICKAHGGTIRVESEPGQGSRFVVSLPSA